MGAISTTNRRAGAHAEDHGLGLEIRGLAVLLLALALLWLALSHGTGTDRYVGAVAAVFIGAAGHGYLDRGGRWRRGAGGERRVGKRLARLERSGWAVAHDVAKPTGGNIDHIAAGPGVVFTIETKLNRFGKRELAQARSHARYVEGVLRRPVVPVLCVANGKSKPKEYAGVWCVGLPGLAGMLERQATGGGPADPWLVARLQELL